MKNSPDCPKCGGITRPQWVDYAQRFGMYGPDAMEGVCYWRCEDCGFRRPVRSFDEVKEG